MVGNGDRTPCSPRPLGVVGLVVLLLTLGGVLTLSHCSTAGGTGGAHPGPGSEAMSHGSVAGPSDEAVLDVSAPSGPAVAAVDPGPDASRWPAR